MKLHLLGKQLYYKITIGLGTILNLFLYTKAASAQYGLQETADKAGLKQGSVEQYTGDIIGAFLVLSGSIFLALIVYGGILYMLSQGEAEKVKKAKNIIIYSVVGVIILATSYAILTFVFGIFT